MKLAAQLYTIRDFTKTPEDIRKSLKKISEIGYDYVQVSAFGPIEPELLKEYADESGVKICATHTPTDRILNDTEKVIEEHKLWGCDYIGWGWVSPENVANAEKFIEELLPAARKIADVGLKLVLHNHGIEFNKRANGKNFIDYVCENTKPEEIGLLADMYWVQAGGKNPVEYIHSHADRIDVVHFKDLVAKTDGQIIMSEIFEGNMDYDAIYKACLEEGIKFAAVEQDICPGDPFDSLKISYDNMKKRNMF